MAKAHHTTSLGKYYLEDSIKLLKGDFGKKYKGKVQLILTSPPFPLNEKKKYGNLQGEDYKKWFVSLAEIFSDLLTETGSIVIELGNAWETNRPVQSLLPMESLLEFVKNPKANLKLCQQFVCYNPSRLPSPAPWVTIKRIRTIDSYTNVWWMAKTDFPKADNKKVLRPYSKSMLKLLKDQKYNSGKRPSEHVISKTSFLKNHSGSIMHNVIEIEQIDPERDRRMPENIFSIANTKSNNYFLRRCREENIVPHPARMQVELAKYFIEFLTEPGDLVLDPFAGTNTTGFCAQIANRKWLSIEIDPGYAKQAIIKIEDPLVKEGMKI